MVQFLGNCALVLSIIAVCLAAPTTRNSVCGYEGCNLGDPNKLNVHIVPHTHDDVGWLKTVDQYFYGAHNDIQHAGVQYILDSVMSALSANPDRRFIYVEMAFFWRWWRQQSDDMKNKVRQFVNEGRLEFISGGWCMNDEASTHYNSIIDQHSLGAGFLKSEFGDCARPKIGWQIDPFGHSREQASLLAQMGFDGLFFGRADFQDIDNRSQMKAREMVWKGSANLDRNAWLFTGILPRGYGPPGGFCYDYFCRDQPIMDDPGLDEYNVPERVQAFIQAAQSEAASYATNHIIMTMGSDFQSENANEWFKNLDKIIKYVNNAPANISNLNVFYSTPSCYLYALNQLGRGWPSKADDFFPYAHREHSFWTGYFTSRAALKGYERLSNNILQVARQLNVFANTSLSESIFRLSEPLGIAQHHDAVSGTEKQAVAFDYAERLAHGIKEAEHVVNQAYNKLLPKTNSTPEAPQFFCQLLNISECLALDGQPRFTLTLWNPTVHSVSKYVRIPVRMNYSVRDPSGTLVTSELFPISSPTFNIPDRTTVTENVIVFQVQLPPLGFNTYYLEEADDENSVKNEIVVTENDACTLENDFVQVVIDAQGNLQQITNKKSSISTTFKGQGFYWYQSFPGNNSKPEFQASGAYIFRPLSSTPDPVATSRSIKCYKGQQIQSAVIVFNDWAAEEFILYNGAESVEVEWTVGPIPFDDNIGKEIILRYDTDVQSQSKYYTDANGREVLQRIRDFRPTWNYNVSETVSGNYYPINSRIWIKDDNRQFTVLTDRSEGGASITDGSVEIMVHRRIAYDDSLGVGEPLNEQAFGTGLVVRGRHHLILETPSSSALKHRVMSQNIYMHPLATFSLTTLSYSDYSNSYRQTWSALTAALPLNVHLLTFDQWSAKDYLVRVEHYFELFEDSTYSQIVKVDLQVLFTTLGNITNIQELTLGANAAKNDVTRLQWLTSAGETMITEESKQQSAQGTVISLSPMQISTFLVTIATTDDAI